MVRTVRAGVAHVVTNTQGVQCPSWVGEGMLSPNTRTYPHWDAHTQACPMLSCSPLITSPLVDTHTHAPCRHVYTHTHTHTSQ